MFLKTSAVIVILLTAAIGVCAQTPTPEDAASVQAAEQKISQLRAEIELLKQQQEYEKVKNDISNAQLRQIMDALPKNSSVKAPDGKTTFGEDKQPNIETLSLSYEALKELTAQIGKDMTRSTAGQYSAMVIYYEPDFLALGKYRLYRSQSKIALKNYELVAEKFIKLNKDGSLAGEKLGDVRAVGGVNPLAAFLSLPSIATSYAESVAELFAVFRTETTITQSSDTINPDSLAVAVANEFKKSNPGLRIYYPQSFVPEYDLDSEGDDSVFARAARIKAAYTYLDELLAQSEKMPEAQRGAASLKEILSLAKMVKNQLQPLVLEDSASATAARGVGDSARTSMPEFRQMIRAEKLDRFLRAGEGGNQPQRVSILKLRLLASGGSRRETRNLFLGSKVRYSGSAVVEVQLFNTDGTLQSSQILSHNTGFRKMKAVEIKQ